MKGPYAAATLCFAFSLIMTAPSMADPGAPNSVTEGSDNKTDPSTQQTAIAQLPIRSSPLLPPQAVNPKGNPSTDQKEPKLRGSVKHKSRHLLVALLKQEFNGQIHAITTNNRSF